MDRHDAGLNRIGSDLDQVKKDVHEIRVTLRERDQMMAFLRTVFLALLGVFLASGLGVVTQIGVTVYWAGQLNTTVNSLTTTVSDHEARLRETDKVYRMRNP